MPLLPALPQEQRSLFSIEHDWHNDLLNFVQTSLPKILIAFVIAFAVQRVVVFIVRRLRRRADSLVGQPQRAAQLRTVAGILRNACYGLLAFYLVLECLGAIGVPLGPFIASAGVLGLGISFGAQSIFKDVLNGFFILVEDQYSVGDVVKLASLTGSVESLTLRITRLRDGDGTVYIIPNSQITTVSNLSRDFSVATLPVSVGPHENPDRITALLGKLAGELRSDAAFKELFLGDPVVLGVDKISGGEVIYPVNLRVRANQRDGVLRELRRRILIAFEQEGIEFGTGSSTLVLQRSDPTGPPPS